MEIQEITNKIVDLELKMDSMDEFSPEFDAADAELEVLEKQLVEASKEKFPKAFANA